MRRTCVATLALAVLMASVGLGTGAEPTTTASPEELQAEGENSNQFAVELFGQLGKAQTGNMCLSPYGIRTAFLLSYAGARGETAKQMANVLRPVPAGDRCHAVAAGLSEILKKAPMARMRPWYRTHINQRAYVLTLASSAWGDSRFDYLPGYRDLLRDCYDAPLQTLSFAQPHEAARLIDAWAVKATDGKVTEVIPPGTIDRKTALIIVNVACFGANWDGMFVPALTRDEPFCLVDGQTVAVPMMHKLVSVEYYGDNEIQTFAIPYQEKAVAMHIVLPREKNGLASIEKRLTWDKINGWLSAAERASFELGLPRFRFENELDLGKSLAAMGMPDAFMPERADFSGILGQGRPLWIDKAFHKTMISVDERGTQITATTGIHKFSGGPDKSITVDHPFLFFVRHQATGTILFVGRVTDPSSSH